MNQEITFIGLNPSRVKISKSKNSAYKRFHEWLDFLEIKHCSFTNLSADPEWDFKYSTLDCTFLFTSINKDGIIIAWGDKVSQYLTRMGIKNHFVIPHPSGLNRKLNDHKYVHHTLKECKEYIRENSNSIR